MIMCDLDRAAFGNVPIRAFWWILCRGMRRGGVRLGLEGRLQTSIQGLRKARR